MSILKFKNPDGTWKSVTAIQGEPGKDGAIQYKPGKGINITEDNVIEAEFEDITVDETPVEGSNNPVSSGGVFDALKNVNPNLQFTEMPDINTVDVDKVIQYIGETNEQFTKGYWYKVSESYTKEHATILAGMSYVTDIIPSNHKVECVVDCTSYINDGHVFGLYDPAHSQYTINSMNLTMWQKGYWWGTDGTHINGVDNVFKAGIHKFVFNEKGEDGNYHITIDDEIVDTVKCKGDTQLALFMRGNAANFSGVFYHFKVWDLDTDELLLHLVPYELNGAGALYDLVSNEAKYTNKSMVCAGSNINTVRQWVQVDTQPTSIGWPEYDCPIVVVSCRMIDNVSEPRYIVNTEPAGIAILEKCNDMLSKGITLFVLRILTPDQQHIGYLDVLVSLENNTVAINTFEIPKFFETYKYLMPSIENFMSISGGQIVPNNKGYVLRIRNWMIGNFYEIAPKSALSSYAQTSAVLLKTNTTSYTPTSNFHPATKKYVDDNFNNIPTIQYDTMPNIDTFDENKIIQYVGETDEQFTKGYWYTVDGKGTVVSGQKEYATISSGTIVNLGIIPTNHKVEFCCEWGSNISGVPSLGTYDTTDTNGTKANKYMHFTVFQNKYYWGTNGAEYSYGTYQTGKHTIIFNEGEDYKTILDDVVIGTGKATGQYPLILFGRGLLNTFNGRFYHIKIWDLSTNELIMHVVPRTNSSNASELYDLVSKQAIYTGSGVNANGPSVSSAGEKYWVPVEVQENNGGGSGDAKGFYTYKVDLGNIGFTGETNEYGWITHTVTDLCKAEINDLINKMLTDDIRQPLVVIENTNTEADLKSMLLFGFDTEYDPATMQSLDFTLHGVANYIGSATGSTMMKYENAVMFAGSGIVTDGVWDASVLVIAATTQQSLTTDNQMEYTPTGDYNPATKKYVDDAISNGGSVSAGTYYLEVVDNSHNWNWSTTSVDLNYSLTGVQLAQLSEICTNAYNDALNGLDVKLYIKQIARPGNKDYHSYNIVELTLESVNPDVPTTVFVFRGTSTRVEYPKYIMNKQLRVVGSWNNEIFTATSGTYNVINLNYKSKQVYWDNASTITPTGDYNPATKKYVDDAIAGASGGITSESDPTVPSWAKQPNKPTYTASEVGALPASTVIPTVPTNLSAFNDDLGTSPKHSHSQYLTAHQDISGKQNKVLYGIADPTSDIGAEGDIYVKYV